jgi:hypothetical protein
MLGKSDASGVAAALFDGVDVTEGAKRGAPGLGGRHAGRDVLVDLLFEVDEDLRLHGAIDVLTPEERAQPQAQPVECATHRYASLTTSPMAADRRFQLSSSRSSCFRPAAVSA